MRLAASALTEGHTTSEANKLSLPLTTRFGRNWLCNAFLHYFLLMIVGWFPESSEACGLTGLLLVVGINEVLMLQQRLVYIGGLITGFLLALILNENLVLQVIAATQKEVHFRSRSWLSHLPVIYSLSYCLFCMFCMCWNSFCLHHLKFIQLRYQLSLS